MIGIAVAAVFGVYGTGLNAFRRPVEFPPDIRPLNSATDSAAQLLDFALGALFYAIGIVLVITLLRLLVRRQWVADVLASLLFATLLPGNTDLSDEVILRAFLTINSYVLLRLLRRVGLLSVLAAIAVPFLGGTQPFGGWGTWYANRALLAHAVFIGTAAWALWVIVSAPRRPIAE
jgi:hypothetical protein